MEKKYIVTLSPGEDGNIVAECPTLPGCVSQGKTREEALEISAKRLRALSKCVEHKTYPFLPPISSRSASPLDGYATCHLRPRCGQSIAKLGFVFHRQKGSHIILYHPNGRHLSVPDHRELDRGTLRALIRGAGVTVEDFVALI